MPDETSGAWSGAPDTACRALHEGAVLVDRGSRLRIRMGGPTAYATLNGLVTNDVTALSPGSGQYAAALTSKGKVIADVRIFATDDGLLLDTSAAAGPGLFAMIRKFVNPRFAKYADAGATVGDLGIFGVRSLHILRMALGGHHTVPDDMPAFASRRVSVDAGEVLVARVPDYGVEGYDLFATPDVLRALADALEEQGALRATDDALTAARIEAGRPAWGVDMDESTLAQEADMERLDAISFTKGCYTGQETVARVHFRGHVNRLLRGLRIVGGTLPATGDTVVTQDGKPVGEVRSVAHAPAQGGLALALIRREVDPGTRVRAGDQEATVVALPFSAPA